MSSTIKNRIREFLQEQGGWVHGGEVEELKHELNVKAGTINRRARELAESGDIERDENEKGEVMYRSLQKKRIVTI